MIVSDSAQLKLLGMPSYTKAADRSTGMIICTDHNEPCGDTVIKLSP